MTMTDTQQRILSPEQLAEWTPAHRRMYAWRLPKSWPRVRELLALSEQAASPRARVDPPADDPGPAEAPPEETSTDLQAPPIVITWEPPEHRRIKVAEILEACAKFAMTSVIEMKSPRRDYAVSRPRQAAMYLATKHTGRSLPEIGRLMGGKDHSTVIHGRNRVRDDLKDGGEIFGPIIAHVERELGVA